MKKVMMIAALAAALVSCQSKGTQNNDAVAMDESVMAVTGNDSSAVAVYEGILPAADGPGIQYVLSVDSVGPDGESGYTLVTTYLDAEGPGIHVRWRKQEIYNDNLCSWKEIVPASQNNSAGRGLEQ